MVFDKIRLLIRRPQVLGMGSWGLLLGLGLLGAVSAAEARSEPGLLAVQRAALAHAGLSPGATTRLLVREHLSALLPQVRFTIGRGWQLSATGRPLDGLSAATTVDDDRTSYAVSASWDLTRLLAPHEALALHNAEPRLAQQRLALLVRVNGLFAARCLLLQQAQPGAAERVAELEAALDLITGGHRLPVVTPETICPAVPRLTVAFPHAPSASRTSTVSRRRPGPESAAAAEDERPLDPPGAPEAPDYGFE